MNKSSPEHAFWDVLLDVAVCFLLASLAVAGTLFLLTRTDYLYRWDDARANGVGPYELSFYIAVTVFMLYFVRRLWPRARLAFLASDITVVDRVAGAVILWGAFLWFAEQWYSASLPSIDWQRVARIMILGQAVWGVSLLWVLARLGWAAKKALTRKESAQKPRLLSDNPIRLDSEADLLGRNNIVHQITSVAREYDSEGAFVVAVTGEWGEGKTTVLQLVLREFKGDNRIIPVEFDPWYFSVGNGRNLDAILKRFFEALEDAIESRMFRPNVSRIIGRYYKAISPALDKASIDLGFLFEEGNENLAEIKRELNAAIRDLEARIVVIIDDLDRMDGLEIAYVFKLIRLCANFDNVLYLVAFGRSFVEEQLEREIGPKARDYVDKIVQLELPLPKVEPAVIERVFVDYLTAAEVQLGITLLNDQAFSSRLQGIFPQVVPLLPNIRLIKLFINRYLLVVPELRGEVNYYDLLVLELIRLRCPSIYEAIYRNPERFTYLNNINWGFPGEDAERAAQFYGGLVAELPQEKSEAVISLLSSVFFSVKCYHERMSAIQDQRVDSRYLEQKSAAHPYYFPRFFYLAVQQGAFSDVEWDNFIARINASTEQQMRDLVHSIIDEHLDADSVEKWISRLRLSVPKIKHDQIASLALVLAEKSPQFSNERPLLLGWPDFRYASLLVADLLGQLDPGESERGLTRLIDSCPDIEFLHYVMYWLDPERARSPGSEPVLRPDTFERLKEYTRDLLRKTYIEGSKNILAGPHHSGGLYALKYFLEPAERTPYVQQLLEEGENSFLFLRALMSRGHRANVDGDGSGSYRVLDYATVKELAVARKVLQAAERLSEAFDADEDGVWLVNALRRAIAEEAAGKNVRRIQEQFHPGRRDDEFEVEIEGE